MPPKKAGTWMDDLLTNQSRRQVGIKQAARSISKKEL